MLHLIGRGDADIARSDEFLQIRDRDDVVVQAARPVSLGMIQLMAFSAPVFGSVVMMVFQKYSGVRMPWLAKK